MLLGLLLLGFEVLENRVHVLVGHLFVLVDVQRLLHDLDFLVDKLWEADLPVNLIQLLNIQLPILIRDIVKRLLQRVKIGQLIVLDLLVKLPGFDLGRAFFPFAQKLEILDIEVWVEELHSLLQLLVCDLVLFFSDFLEKVLDCLFVDVDPVAVFFLHEWVDVCV